MRIVGTITVTAGSRSVHEVSDISRDDIAFSGDESVLGGTSVSDATSRAQLANVMFRISWRDVVVDTQLGYWRWVLAFLIGAVPAAAQVGLAPYVGRGMSFVSGRKQSVTSEPA